MSDRNTARFLAIFHSWHVSSKKWEEIQLDVNTRDEAEEKAYAILGRKKDSFYNWDFTLIDLQEYDTSR